MRNNFGDYLVVLMLYYFFRSFMNLKPIYIALLTLCIAYTVEFLQLINVIEILNLEQHTITKIILGTTFSMHDIIAYTLGFLTIVLIEKINTFVAF
ncbi:ribosomal maturation YjgA family protein [Lutibacter agarilyticus]